MSQSGDTPHQQGVADHLSDVLPVSETAYWSFSDEDRALVDAFLLQCWSDWQADDAAAAKAAADSVAEFASVPQFVDGPTIPAGLDLTEVFAAVPPEHLFDEDLCEEFLYAEYIARGLHADRSDADSSDADPSDAATADLASASLAHGSPARGDPPALDPLAGLSPFQRRQAQFVDRVLYFEKVIAWAQASKAEVLTEAWDYTTNTAETGRPLAGPQHEHDWDATFAAQQGLVAEMACALRIPAGTASGLLHESRVLVESRPQTLESLRSGEISLRHARRVLDQLDSVPQPARAELEAVLLPHAKRLTPAQFDGKARKLRERFHPDSITVRRAKCLADRRVTLYPDKDGMSTLWLRAASDDLQGIYTRVTDAALSLQGPDEPRTLSQLRADVTTDLLAQGVTNSGLGAGPGAYFTAAANVNVTVPVLTLMGKSEEPGELEGYGPIDPETARRLAGTATSFLRILTHPHTGIVLGVSSTPFRVPAALKKYLRLRDGTCRFPGCNRSAGHSDLDHTRDKQFGGPTTANNLHFLCPVHHNLKHYSAWTVIADPDGTLNWTSPAGKHYATDPATRISPRPPQISPPAEPPPSAEPPPPLNDPWTSDWNTTDRHPHPF
ncbi:HNH endonuclease signature motif containing protein [Cryobacterium ruanii]|uniref:HNH endonuclease n=1 Tax=Cryobacterium ruanii TaxID=1259197 RepID=A0A4V3ITA4_9MICO|nr:HNH endonuclease signature motif containing protein [Cryobacterium ruanii]TFD65340.1 HNH endonuclease [Cryobacterium ruanii]